MIPCDIDGNELDGTSETTDTTAWMCYWWHAATGDVAQALAELALARMGLEG